jgi:hypothetical protein
MAKPPEFKGPLDNPAWSDKENRDYDRAENRSSPQLARQEALGRRGSDTEIDIGKIASRARGLLPEEPKSNHKPRTSKPKKRPYRARYKDSTDYSKRQLDDVDAY